MLFAAHCILIPPHFIPGESKKVSKRSLVSDDDGCGGKLWVRSNNLNFQRLDIYKIQKLTKFGYQHIQDKNLEHF